MELRKLALPLAALVALTSLAGLAAADGTSGSPSSPPPACAQDTPCADSRYRDCMAKARQDGTVTADEERMCQDDYCARIHNDWCARYCRENAGRPPCKTEKPSSSGPSNSSGPSDVPAGARSCFEHGKERDKCVKEYCREHESECKRFCHEHPGAGFCAFKPSGGERHITFEPLADGTGLANLTVRGLLVLSSVRMQAEGEFESRHSDHKLRVEVGKNRLELHDAAAGFLRFEGPDAIVTLTFPPGAIHELGPAGKKAFIHYGAQGTAQLDSRNMTWLDERTVQVTEFFAFHVNKANGAETPERIKVKDAIERGDKVGAEIRVHRGAEPEVFAYDRVDVELRASRDKPTQADPIRVILSSELPEGRTFVLHINRTVMDVEAGRVHLRYFDLPDGANGTARTEVVFLAASSLDDILDPNDDSGQPEYYIVRDQNGLQVLVSVPHWSVHMVELSSLAELVTPSVLIGVAAGAGAVAIAAVALFVPRRRNEP